MLDYLKEQLKIEKTITFGTIEGKYTYLINPGDFNRVVKLVKTRYCTPVIFREDFSK